jgi:hypothetical protein
VEDNLTDLHEAQLELHDAQNYENSINIIAMIIIAFLKLVALDP